MSGAPESGDGEELDEAGDEVVGLGEPRLRYEDRFLCNLCLNEVQIPRGLQWGVAKPKQGAVGFAVLALGDQPAGRFGTEEDAQDDRYGRDESGTELQAPGDVAGVDDGQIGTRAQEDAKGRPDLPGHHETAANAGGCHLCRKDGHRDFL